ncbi:hypothetical protein E2C01_017821 [Portunus trituberculatus]|uniref:Uncharacterized protein n=1 Tax=Portunus trituberculatus TaxID=210409 RepID=A0A5B7DUJ2_PORTR|nr:hypothetical protein [Portunus trituberculatus]
MPRCRGVSPLREVAGECVFRWLKWSLRLQPGPRDRQKLRQHMLNTLAPRPRQALLSQVLAMPNVVMDTKCQLVEVLGDTTTWCADLTPGGELYVDEVFHLYRSLTMAGLINITHLGMMCNIQSLADRRYLPDVNSTFYRLMGHLRHLVWVTLCGVADNTMLAALGANCHALQYLDVSSSPRVDDVGVGKLLLRGKINMRDLSLLASAPLPPTSPCCASLTFLGVSQTEAGVASVVLLLRCLRQITSLGGCISDGSMVDVLQVLKAGGVADWPTSLTKVWEPRVLPHHAPLLVAACPALHSLITQEVSVSSVSLLPPLLELTIDLCLRGDTELLYEMLETSGSTLTHFVLEGNINCPLEMSFLMSAAPQLRHLKACVYLEEGCEVQGWASLASAEVGVTTCKGIVALLTHTPALRRLTLSLEPEPYAETWRDLDDGVLGQVMGGGGLEALEQLVVTRCGMTPSGLESLMLHCQHLELVAPLIQWPAITLDDLVLLRKQIVCSNWCLDLQLSLESPLKPVA